MRTIHKYELRVQLKDVAIRLPIDACVVHVAVQNNAVNMWVELESGYMSEDDTEMRHFRVFGTGWDIPGSYVYVGTGITPDGDYVWHVYERGDR